MNEGTYRGQASGFTLDADDSSTWEAVNKGNKTPFLYIIFIQ